MTDFIADLHIHSKYSGGCSKNLDIETLSHYASLKGLSILATGDFTYSKWLSELKNKLEFDAENQIYRSRNDKVKVYFILQAEVNLIAEEHETGAKRIHHIILAPNFDVAEQINHALSRYGSLESDARPSLKIQAPEFIEVLKQIDDYVEVIPAHIFTPWYGLLGSFNGYDNIKECYKDKSSEIYCLETGLSADPSYIYSISQLDGYSIISCSDLHSFYPHRIGREATVFDLNKPSYYEIIGALRSNDSRLKMTIEFRPEEGKYNYDGCRADHHSNRIDFYCHPSETLKLVSCPICHRKITKGVLSRVISLSDRPLGFKPEHAKPYKHTIPLTELIAYTYKVGSPWSKKVLKLYEKLIGQYGSEYNILLNEQPGCIDLQEQVDEALALNICSVKQGNFYFDPPGHDGVYGVLRIGDREKLPAKGKETGNISQKFLTDY